MVGNQCLFPLVFSMFYTARSDKTHNQPSRPSSLLSVCFATGLSSQIRLAAAALSEGRHISQQTPFHFHRSQTCLFGCLVQPSLSLLHSVEEPLLLLVPHQRLQHLTLQHVHHKHWHYTSIKLSFNTSRRTTLVDLISLTK